MAENKQPEFTRSIFWEDGKVVMVDQQALPGKFVLVSFSDYKGVADAIKIMTIRGAPAIGAAGAFGMALAAHSSTATTSAELITELKEAQKHLDAARPTAVNLTWATNRIMELVAGLLEVAPNTTPDFLNQRVLEEAKQLAEDDVVINKKLGAYGADLIKAGTVENPTNLLHHCNTGRLATVDYGTALGVIYTCHEQKKNIHVYVDETRPRCQGSKLTAWELMKAGVPMHLIADNAAGLLMYQGKVDAIVFGADRVAANGDVVNKIGTYKVSVCGAENKIPVYACVPVSTIDLNVATGREIEIEERHPDEVLRLGGELIAPAGCPVFNPAFDIAPYQYITAIITEEGVCYPPYTESLKKVKELSEARIKANWQARLKEHLDAAKATSA